MNGIDRADAFARWWVECYTATLPAPVADRRRAEICSDVWEQRAWATTTDTAPARVAVSIIRRVVVGMAADLWWRRAQLAATRGRPATSGPPLWSWLRRTWWQALAVLIGGIEVGTGVSTPFEDPTRGGLIGGVITAAAGVLVLAGVAVRRHQRTRGDAMIAVGVLPVVPWYWTYVFPIAAVTVFAAALVDAADGLPSATDVRRPAGDRIHVGLVVALAAALVGGIFVGSAGAAVVLVSPVLAALVAHAVVRRRSGVVPTIRAALLLIAVGVGNAVLTVVVGVLGSIDDVALPRSTVTMAAAITTLAIVAGIGLLTVARSASHRRPNPTRPRR